MPDKKSMLPFNYTNASSPLDNSPYYSRIVEHQIHPIDDLPQEGNASNYVLLGFRPGLPLQAAELNEVQENFFMQQSLTTTMMHNWITSGIPFRWGDIGYPSGIESIGGTDTDGSVEQPIPGAEHTVVSGPGWKGTTPLFPFLNPDIEHRDEFNAPQVGSGLVEIVEQGTNLSVTFREGWYLTELRRNIPYPLQTGFKYWAFLEDDMPISVPKTQDQSFEVGFLLNLKEVEACDSSETCNPWVSDEPRDISLNDYSSGAYNQNTGGANRIRIEFSSVQSSSNFNVGDISSVLKVIPSRQEVRYMNNLLVYTWE